MILVDSQFFLVKGPTWGPLNLTLESPTMSLSVVTVRDLTESTTIGVRLRPF